jgi:hypothetical protein
VAFSDEQITTMRQKLGIAEDADEATILAALDEALESAPSRLPTTTATPEIPEGHVVIPAGEAGRPRGRRQAGHDHGQDAARQERDAFLDGASGEVPAGQPRTPGPRSTTATPRRRASTSTAPGPHPGPRARPRQPRGRGQSEDDAVYAALFGDEKAGA